MVEIRSHSTSGFLVQHFDLTCAKCAALLDEQHGINVLVNDHAGSLVVGETRIGAETESGEEAFRRLQILDRKIYEIMRIRCLRSL